jgi:hypothetical protein
MQELACGACGNRVLVEKFSPTHTSVQWLDDAESACPVFADKAAAGVHSKWIPTCEKLRDTIAQAAAAGVIPMDTHRHEPVLGRIR